MAAWERADVPEEAFLALDMRRMLTEGNREINAGIGGDQTSLEMSLWGKHQFSFGADYMRMQLNYRQHSSRTGNSRSEGILAGTILWT